MTQSVEVAGISQIFWQSTVAEVSLSRNGFLQSVELKDLHNSDGRMESKMSDPTNPTRLSCTALLLCSGQQYQSCERDVFAAINDCGLVFDGGLVVDLVSPVFIECELILHFTLWNSFFIGIPYSRSVYIRC